VYSATVTTTLRGVGSAVSYAAVWALFAGAVTLAWRRRILGFVLQLLQPLPPLPPLHPTQPTSETPR
jgi:hypothetical protein